MSLRHPLTPAQRKQVEQLQQNAQVAQTLLNTYLQGIVDGIPDTDGVRWRLDGDALVGEKPDITPKP